MRALSASRIAASEAPSHVLVMLHGIYGRGRNWQAIARSVAEARPEYACWLVDLPHHGGSPGGAHGDTVRGLAEDVDDWLGARGLTADAILGHSFGGKVALAFAERRRDQALQVWLIDSTPDAREPTGSAWNLLRVVRSLPDRFPTREDAFAALVRGGFAPPVARWMSTNLARDGDGFTWRLDFDAMERLLRDFFSVDLWPVLERPAPLHDVHVLQASESSVISGEAAARMTAAPGGRVRLHEAAGGHWIHTEAPELVSALLIDHLP